MEVSDDYKKAVQHERQRQKFMAEIPDVKKSLKNYYYSHTYRPVY